MPERIDTKAVLEQGLPPGHDSTCYLNLGDTACTCRAGQICRLHDALAQEIAEHEGDREALGLSEYARDGLGNAVICLQARIEALEKERDLAIAHDRQPYPTAWAYEQLAKAHGRKTEDLRTIAKEAEIHREEYDQRCCLRVSGVVMDEGRNTTRDYWRGRRDEAGHFRDCLVAGLAAEEKKP